jgi:hypothetical protein
MELALRPDFRSICSAAFISVENNSPIRLRWNRLYKNPEVLNLNLKYYYYELFYLLTVITLLNIENHGFQGPRGHHHYNLFLLLFPRVQVVHGSQRVPFKKLLILEASDLQKKCEDITEMSHTSHS